MSGLSVSVVVPTYQRGEVLLHTIDSLMVMSTYHELLIVDQTGSHDAGTISRLQAWHEDGWLRWIKHKPVGVVGAMNRGLREARGDLVLFLDDDIRPGTNLVKAHQAAYDANPSAWAVVGRVIQPEASSLRKVRRSKPGALTEDLDFDFSRNEGGWVTNVMAGNLSVRREKALDAGGFDEKFIPPVSYRFETEFAKRLIAAAGRIRYEPSAILHHLRAPRGGTRAIGSHLTSASPLHGVGDYYYALKCGRGLEKILYILRRPLREVFTRFHLRHPWWIPIKFIGELRGLLLAFRLWRGRKS